MGRRRSDDEILAVMGFGWAEERTTLGLARLTGMTESAMRKRLNRMLDDGVIAVRCGRGPGERAKGGRSTQFWSRTRGPTPENSNVVLLGSPPFYQTPYARKPRSP